jgi:hypothetical protein
MVFRIAISLGSGCIPVGAMFFKVNRREDSQAGRRGFESRLPLHFFSITYRPSHSPIRKIEPFRAS